MNKIIRYARMSAKKLVAERLAIKLARELADKNKNI